MKEIEEYEISEILNLCDNAINEGTCDNFRSYEEGVKDAINWLYYGDPKA